MQSKAGSHWRHYLLNKLWREPVRIFIAMSSCAAFAWYHQQIVWTIPLILGVVAAALADMDDRLTGRFKNIFLTLVCFALASISVELLFPYPWLFACGLALSSWGFILLGALGQRYATIAFGALLIAIYTMLGIGLFPHWFSQPTLLLMGASGYYLLTVVNHLFFPVRPLQAQLTNTYLALADYLEMKASIFDPALIEGEVSVLYTISTTNSRLVTQLNSVKTAIQSRLRGERAAAHIHRSLLYYFVAQEIHERANSSHVEYQHLRQQCQLNELLFRLQRLMTEQAQACRNIAHSLERSSAYQHNAHLTHALQAAEQVLTRISAQADPATYEPLRWLLKNLRAIDEQLASIASDTLHQSWQSSDTALSTEGLQGWHDVRLRFKRHFSTSSPLFRHAIRLSIVLCVGDLIIHLMNLKHGYWILLTALFVCQPNYNATRRRLTLRIFGTLGGIALGLPLLWLVPSLPGQLVCIVLFGGLFFIFRQIHYAQATLFITSMVLFCFNLLGQGYNIALPRIIDTLIGCGLAWIAVAFIFPDWRYQVLPQVINKAYLANLNYLGAVIQQYHDGKDNRVSYRIARREAHNADAEFASVVANTENEVQASSVTPNSLFTLLCLNHSLLGYIAALGAHRQKLLSAELLTLLTQVEKFAADILQPEFLSEPTTNNFRPPPLLANLSESTQGVLIIQQASLIIKLLTKLITLRGQLLKK